MLTTSQTMAAITTNSQVLSVGVDIGNGYTKVISNDDRAKIPSYIAPCAVGEFYESLGDGAYIEILESSNTDMTGTRWLVGSDAYLQKPLGYLRVSDDPRGKVAYSLPLLLGALAQLPHRTRSSLVLATQSQDAQTLGGAMEESISGNHTARINNRITSISVVDVFCLEEGTGAVFSAVQQNHVPTSGRVLLVDMGYGTLISCHFANRKLQPGSRKVLPTGVNQLVELIAKDPDTRKQLLQEGNSQIIRTGIERGDFLYGTTSWNFKPIYARHIKPWAASGLAFALKSLSPWKAEADAAIAVGGGVLMPGIPEALTRNGFTTLPDPQWANVRGLALAAQMKARRLSNASVG